MTFSSLCIFLLVLGAGAAIPGPDIVAILARALSHGFKNTLALISGILFGHALWTVAAALGLVVLVQTLGSAFVVIKFAAAIYLIYLAWNLWNAHTEATLSSADNSNDRRSGFISARGFVGG